MNGICHDVAWIIFCLYGIYLPAGEREGKTDAVPGPGPGAGAGACVAMTAAVAFVRLLLLRMLPVWHCINVLPFN